MNRLPEGYSVPETDEALLAECEVQVFRATGPGGQSVNTTDSAVRLIHRPSGFVVVGRRERSQLRNKADCLKRLRLRLVDAQRVSPKRVATRPSRAAVQRRLESKSKLSAKKATRRRPPEVD
jgi:protein subunit release factor A